MNLPILTDGQERAALIGVGALGGGAVLFGEGTTRTLGAVALAVALFLAWKAGMLGQWAAGTLPGIRPQDGDDGDGQTTALPSPDDWINVLETAPDGTVRPGQLRLWKAAEMYLAGGINGYTIEPADQAAATAIALYLDDLGTQFA